MRKNSNPPERKAFSVNEFCRATSLGRTTVYALLKNGSLPSALIGGRRLIPADAIDDAFTCNSSTSRSSCVIRDAVAAKPYPRAIP